MERENQCLVTPPGVKGQAASGSNREGESTEALESFEIIRRVWADENFVHHGKYWTVQKAADAGTAGY
jgi:alkanesulfonate monooxygenase SsuD/methylene tetrahydromethanopterin reductase-like flavin-dependent oxidoreductase (luciferase family)